MASSVWKSSFSSFFPMQGPIKTTKGLLYFFLITLEWAIIGETKGSINLVMEGKYFCINKLTEGHAVVIYTSSLLLFI